MTFRSKAILQAAKDSPKCFGCDNPNDGTVVSCHSNKISDGKGTGHKAKDSCIAYMCFVCYKEYDEGKLDNWTKNHRDIWFNEASLKSLRWLFESGKAVVK